MESTLQWEELSEETLCGITGGTGSDEFARDVGRVVGAIAGAIYVVGRSLAQSIEASGLGRNTC